MPTSLSIASVIEKNKIASEVPFLVLLDVAVVDPASLQTVEHIYLVRNNEDITYQGNTHTAAPFDLELKAESGAIPEIKLAISDYSRAIQAKMQAYGGGVQSKVTVMVVNADALDQPPEVAEYFMVTAATAAGYIVTWTLGAESPLSQLFPRGRQRRDYCRWRYKDAATCGYSGSMPSCDLTLKGPNGCQAHGNVLNFGAFPGIDSSGVRYS